MDEGQKEYYELAEDAPSSSGRTQYMRYMKGERLTQRQAILAQCAHCMGFYRDGRVDCESKCCTLYPHMPYRKV